MLLSTALASSRPPCPICGTAACACRGANEPFIGRPIELAALIEKGDGVVQVLRATEQVWADKNDGTGARELLYNPGDPIRQADAVALGLIDDKGHATQQPRKKAEEPTPKAQPRGARDKAMRGPREKPKTEEE